MAQVIHCDVHNRSHPADVLVSQIANGETMAACFAGYVELARALVADTEVREAERLAAELAARVADGSADQAEADQVAAEAEARLAGGRSPQAEALGVERVVPKGRSRSRAAHEARRRSKRAEDPQAAEPAGLGDPGPAEAAATEGADTVAPS